MRGGLGSQKARIRVYTEIISKTLKTHLPPLSYAGEMWSIEGKQNIKEQSAKNLTWKTTSFLQVQKDPKEDEKIEKMATLAKVFTVNPLLRESKTFCSHRTFSLDDRGRFASNLNCAELEKGGRWRGCVLTLCKIRGIFIHR